MDKKKEVERKRSFFFRNSIPKSSNSDDNFYSNNNDNLSIESKTSRNRDQRKLSVRSFDSEKFKMKKNKKKDITRMSLVEAHNVPMFTNENNHSQTINYGKKIFINFVYFMKYSSSFNNVLFK